MEKETLDLLDAALEAVRGDLMPRVEELAQKSSDPVDWVVVEDRSYDSTCFDRSNNLRPSLGCAFMYSRIA